jgi:DNA-binding transcriptional LysR family regulator
VDHLGSRHGELRRPRGQPPLAGKARVPLRTNHFASQIAAAEAGLGLALLPSPYGHLRALRRARTTRALAAAVTEWPRSELWLVGHRILRDVPRVAAVWTFLLDELRAIRGGEPA